jgi:hypothetical protein
VCTLQGCNPCVEPVPCAGYVVPEDRVLSEADIIVHQDRELGKGSYGVVYAAEYQGRPCVLKVRTRLCLGECVGLRVCACVCLCACPCVSA